MAGGNGILKEGGFQASYQLDITIKGIKLKICCNSDKIEDPMFERKHITILYCIVLYCKKIF
jgi:hypothetical protein